MYSEMQPSSKGLLPHISPSKSRTVEKIKIEKDKDIDNFFTMQQVLGRGSFGVVYAACENTTSDQWAIKIISKTDDGSPKMFHINREIDILKFVDHANIIHLEKIYESPTAIYLVFEKCNGVLYDLFSKKKRFSESETLRVIKDLSEAVAYLHDNGIVHRDIKMENILLATSSKINEDEEDTLFIKLTDFGLSVMKNVNGGHTDMLHEQCGTPHYMSPEVITAKTYSQQCDVWSIGVLTYTLITGRFPFTGASKKLARDAILNDEPNFENFLTNSSSREALIDLLTQMLRKDPAHRIALPELLTHPWICEKPFNTLRGGNVLDKMAHWREEMKVPMGAASDWETATINNNGLLLLNTSFVPDLIRHYGTDPTSTEPTRFTDGRFAVLGALRPSSEKESANRSISTHHYTPALAETNRRDASGTASKKEGAHNKENANSTALNKDKRRIVK